jgi:hypothetical protein
MAPPSGIPMPGPAPSMAAPPAPPAPVPQPVPVPSALPAQPAQVSSAALLGDGDAADYTRLPAELDRRFESLDLDGALRATIINPGDPWTRTAQRSLLGEPTTTRLAAAEQRTEKQKAFDLLDALSKSGALPIEDASLHVILAATHCFDRTLTDTVIQDDINPIEKVERSLLIVGATIHATPAAELLALEQRDRVLASHPQLASRALEGGTDPT